MHHTKSGIGAQFKNMGLDPSKHGKEWHHDTLLTNHTNLMLFTNISEIGVLTSMIGFLESQHFASRGGGAPAPARAACMFISFIKFILQPQGFALTLSRTILSCNAGFWITSHVQHLRVITVNCNQTYRHVQCSLLLKGVFMLFLETLYVDRSSFFKLHWQGYSKYCACHSFQLSASFVDAH